MLTDNEKQIIQSTWAEAMKEKKQLGHAIFLKLFQMYPQHQQLFRDFKNLSEEQLKASPRLKAHGLRVVNTLDAAIQSLDDMEICAESLVLIGLSHKPHNVKVSHFEDLNKVIHEVFKERLGKRYTDHQETWAKLLQGIIPVIQKGL